MAILSSDLIRQGAAGASTGYTIDQSIRFNNADSAYMYRNVDTTFSTKFTFSFWFKGTVSRQYFITWRDKRGSGYAYSYIGVFSDYLGVFEYGDHSAHGLVVKADYRTTRLIRDPAAWYHVVVSFDYTNSIATEQVKIYVNGVRETSFTTSTNNTSYAGQSQSTGSPNYLGIGYAYAVSADYADAYMAEINCIDGYSYGPEYFGEFEGNGIWIPKEYTEAYGTNGFYIKGEDSSDLGNDSSGNNKHFTTTGLQANDQVEDTPTNNKITFNPLHNQRSGGNPKNGNLEYYGPGTRTMIGTTGGPFPTSGKWAIAIKAAQVSTTMGWSYGLQKADDSDMGDAAGSNEDIGAGTGGANMTPQSSDGYYYNYSTSSATDPSLPITTSDEFWLAVDIDSGKYWFGIYDASASGYKWVAADAGLDGDPGAGTNETGSLTGLQNNTGNFEFIFSSKQTSQILYLQREADLAGAVPTGYTYWENVKELI